MLHHVPESSPYLLWRRVVKRLLEFLGLSMFIVSVGDVDRIKTGILVVCIFDLDPEHTEGQAPEFLQLSFLLTREITHGSGGRFDRHRLKEINDSKERFLLRVFEIGAPL